MFGKVIDIDRLVVDFVVPIEFVELGLDNAALESATWNRGSQNFINYCLRG
jgi:hypothetical protein